MQKLMVEKTKQILKLAPKQNLQTPRFLPVQNELRNLCSSGSLNVAASQVLQVTKLATFEAFALCAAERISGYIS